MLDWGHLGSSPPSVEVCIGHCQGERKLSRARLCSSPSSRPWDAKRACLDLHRLIIIEVAQEGWLGPIQEWAGGTGVSWAVISIGGMVPSCFSGDAASTAWAELLQAPALPLPGLVVPGV